jgi:hypothetical protein
VHLHLSPAALAKAKAAGIVAAALTAGGAGGMVALNQVAPPDTAVTVSADGSGATSPTDAAPGPVTDPSARPTRPAPHATATGLPACPAGGSHGDYVRSVATATPAPGGTRGAAVRQAARSDCGKHPAAPAGRGAANPRHTATPHRTQAARPAPSPRHTESATHDSPTDTTPTESTQTGTAQTSGSGSDQRQGGHDH